MNEPNQSYMRVIAICYYVLGGLMCMVAMMPLFHVVIGIMMLSGNMDGKNTQPPSAVMGIMLILMGAFFILLLLTFALTILYTGKCIQQRKYYIFCLVMSGLACSSFPLGTVLGVFSIIMLVKPEIKAEFEAIAAAKAVK